MFRPLLGLIAALLGTLLVLPIVFLALPFWSVSFLSRFYHSFLRLFKPRVLPWQQIIEYEPIIGWKPKANLNVQARADGLFQFTTDANGWRGKTGLAESQVVVFGDSFAFGYGIDDGKFFADLNPNLRIKTIGANGYNMVQELLWMRRLSGLLGGKVVVWFIYHGNDLYENLKPNLESYRMPFTRRVNGTGEWEIVTSHVSPSRWETAMQRQYYERLAQICSQTFLSERVYSACEFLIGQGNEICRDAGATLVVMTVPDITQIDQSLMERLIKLAPDPTTFDPDMPDHKIKEICCKLHIPFVALKRHLHADDYMQRDVHWNERGHQKIAKVLEALFYSHHLKKDSDTECAC